MARSRDYIPQTHLHKKEDIRNKCSEACRSAWKILWLFAALLTGCAVQNQPSALAPKGPEAAQIANLSWLMFTIAGVVLLVVTVLLLIAVLRRRGGAGDLQPAQVQPNDRHALTLVVLGGALVPAVVLIIVMALSIRIENASAADGNGNPVIEVIGHQWWWEVRYPAEAFATANEIHIPVGKSVDIKLTTADVIHSFWVPQLHSKMDMIPGQTNTIVLQADAVGTYVGECAEFCGAEHAHMDFVVIVQTQADYDKWVAQQKQPALDPPPGSLEKKGQQAFLGSSCVYCHTIQGTNASGTLGPDLTHLASRATIGAGARPNTPANLAGWIMNAQAIKPENKMPPMNLDPDQLQEIIAYLEMLK